MNFPAQKVSPFKTQKAKYFFENFLRPDQLQAVRDFVTSATTFCFSSGYNHDEIWLEIYVFGEPDGFKQEELRIDVCTKHGRSTTSQRAIINLDFAKNKQYNDHVSNYQNLPN